MSEDMHAALEHDADAPLFAPLNLDGGPTRAAAAFAALAARWARLADGARWHAAVFRELAWREMRLQYRGTALGLLWSVANPLALGIVYIGLFSNALGAASAQYPLQVLAALIPWTGFTASLCAAAHAPLTHAALLRGHRVPVRLLVGAAATAALPGLIAGLTLLIAGTLFTGTGAFTAASLPAALPAPAILPGATIWPATAAVGMPAAFSSLSAAVTVSPLAGASLSSGALARFAALPALACLPALVLLQLALAAALGLALALANAYLRDTQHALHHALRLVFFVTPIVWLPANLPARFAGCSWLVTANPFAGLAAAYRAILVAGEIPSAASLAPAALATAFIATIALVAEHRAGRRVAELL